MGSTKSNVLYQEVLAVFNFDRETPLTGLTSGNFSFSFIKDGVSYSDPVVANITELSRGMYQAGVVFPSIGFWAVFIDITVGSQELETHQLNVNVVSNDVSDLEYNDSTLTLTLTDGSTLTTEIVAAVGTPPTPSGVPGSSQTPATVGGAQGILSFSSRSV